MSISSLLTQLAQKLGPKYSYIVRKIPLFIGNCKFWWLFCLVKHPFIPLRTSFKHPQSLPNQCHAPCGNLINHFTQIIIFSWGYRVSKGLLYLFCCHNFLYKSHIMAFVMMDYGTMLHKCELKTLIFNLKSIISADWICPGMQEMSLPRTSCCVN